MRKIAIIGGGLAGLISAIQLVRAGNSCTLYEKKSYPLHRVCGEYISNEALPFLKASQLIPPDVLLPPVSRLMLSDEDGDSCKMDLDLGGFGVSRYFFDHHLYRIAVREGVDFRLNTEVRVVRREGEQMVVETATEQAFVDVVIGAFGKRSRLDVQQQRSFVQQRSPWVGVKYHVRTDHPAGLIALHNFPGGYCGVCNVEEGVTNLCYLTRRDNLRRHGDVRRMEEEVLFVNPHLRKIFSHATFLHDRPHVINEVSFARKEPVENHMLMAGDAAGMITPLCGNGMAMAIHSGKLVAALVQSYCAGRISRAQLEQDYRAAWTRLFRRRLWWGRRLQYVFGNRFCSAALVSLARRSYTISDAIIRRTHGEPF